MRRLRLEPLEDRLLLSGLGGGPGAEPPRSSGPAHQGERSPGGDRDGPPPRGWAGPPVATSPQAAVVQETASPSSARQVTPESQATATRTAAYSPQSASRSAFDAPADVSALPQPPASPADLLFAAWGVRPVVFFLAETGLSFRGGKAPSPLPDAAAVPDARSKDVPPGAMPSDPAPEEIALPNPRGAGLAGGRLPADLAGLEAGVRRFLEGIVDGQPGAVGEVGCGLAPWLLAAAAAAAASEFARRRWRRADDRPGDEFRGWLPS